MGTGIRKFDSTGTITSGLNSRSNMPSGYVFFIIGKKLSNGVLQFFQVPKLEFDTKTLP